MFFNAKRLSWIIPDNSGHGWCFQICGPKDLIDVSAHKFLWTRTPPYEPNMDQNTETGNHAVCIGPEAWMLTPNEDPSLGACNGARQNYPPIALATTFLEVLQQNGFKIITSSSEYSIFTWTLM